MMRRVKRVRLTQTGHCLRKHLRKWLRDGHRGSMCHPPDPDAPSVSESVCLGQGCMGQRSHGPCLIPPCSCTHLGIGFSLCMPHWGGSAGKLTNQRPQRGGGAETATNHQSGGEWSQTQLNYKFILTFIEEVEICIRCLVM